MTYADDQNVRSETANFQNVANALDGLLAAYSTSTATSTITTTSTSFVDYTGASIAITVNENEIVLLMADFSASISGSVPNKVTAQFLQDGVAIGIDRQSYFRTANASGDEGNIQLYHIIKPAAGAHTYKLQWKVSGGDGNSTKYYFSAIVLQNT